MSEEQLKEFLAKVHVDPILQAQLNEAECPDDVVSFSKGHGYELTAEKITELRDAELEGVAGGKMVYSGAFRTRNAVLISHEWLRISRNCDGFSHQTLQLEHDLVFIDWYH